jgi:hypothetical protein
LPFKFTGKLNKVAINLTPVKLSAVDKQELKAAHTAISMAQ